MVLINLVKSTPIGLDIKEFPYTATFMQYNKQLHYAIRNKEHLARRFNELNKGTTCPSGEEIIVMLGNFSEVFEEIP